MRQPTLRDHINKITSDVSLSLDERVENIFNMRQHLFSEDEINNRQNDIEYYSCLIDMLKAENGPHTHDLDLLQLYALLSETYVELKQYKPLKSLSYDVLDLLRDECTRWEYMADTLPRILDAVGESVYNHNLYELHLHYIRKAYDSGNLEEGMKGRIRKMLKLRLLLEDGVDFDYRLFNQELQNAVSYFFSPEELMKIMLNPQIGHLRRDPVEYTFKWENIYYDMEAKLEERFANAPRQMGFCFHYWNAKRELLDEEYGIEWRSPSQMNPHVIFD